MLMVWFWAFVVDGGWVVSRLLFVLGFVWFGWLDLVFAMFYCLIGTPDFPWLVFWCFTVNGVLYW